MNRPYYPLLLLSSVPGKVMEYIVLATADYLPWTTWLQNGVLGERNATTGTSGELTQDQHIGKQVDFTNTDFVNALDTVNR